MDVTDVDTRIAALERNLWSMWSQFGRGPACRLHDAPDASWFETPIPVPPYNMVVRFQGQDRPGWEDSVERIFRHFERRGVPFVWLLHPSASPNGLPEALRRRGFDAVEPITGMTADLHDLPPVPVATGVDVQAVTTPAQVEAYMDLVAARWGVPDAARRHHAALGAIVRLDDAASPNRAWLALRDGQPVAKAFTHDGAGVVGLYGMATVPAARGLGLGRLLGLTALHDARARGIRTGILHATPMAVGLYERMGFRAAAPFTVFAAPGSFHA